MHTQSEIRSRSARGDFAPDVPMRGFVRGADLGQVAVVTARSPAGNHSRSMRASVKRPPSDYDECEVIRTDGRDRRRETGELWTMIPIRFGFTSSRVLRKSTPATKSPATEPERGIILPP